MDSKDTPLYVKKLEVSNDRLQSALSASRSTIDEYFEMYCDVNGNKISIGLDINLPIPKNEVLKISARTHNLCYATKTKVDEIERYYLEFCNGDRGYADVKETPVSLTELVAVKFNLVGVRIKCNIKSKANRNGDMFALESVLMGYKGTNFVDTSNKFIYQPYIPIAFNRKPFIIDSL